MAKIKELRNPYICEYCKMSFRNHRSLLDHIDKEHILYEHKTDRGKNK